jgi:2-iminoacetate synthase ThiH
VVSRLVFDNVPYVKCFWVMHGLFVVQLSLNFGVDDLDGLVVRTVSRGPEAAADVPANAA